MYRRQCWCQWMYACYLGQSTEEIKLYSVNRGMSEWLTNKEKNTHCGMQGRLCLRLGVSLPFLQKSKVPHNKVKELAWGQVCYEIKSLYLLAIWTTLARWFTKDSFNRSTFMIKALTPSEGNPNLCLQEQQNIGPKTKCGEEGHETIVGLHVRKTGVVMKRALERALSIFSLLFEETFIYL